MCIRDRGKSSEKAAQKLHFSEKQAAAILDMRLYKLIGPVSYTHLDVYKRQA